MCPAVCSHAGFRRERRLQKSACAFYLLCAFQPVITLCLMPAQPVTMSILRQTPSAGDLLERVSAVEAQFSNWDLAMAFLGFAASAVLSTLFLAAVLRAFRAMHTLGFSERTS